MLPDYYLILRIDPASDLTAIKSAYRRRALECHPDRGGRHEEMVLVNEAWEILGDPDQRRRYDSARRESIPESSISEDFSAARARAANYPARWPEFEQWLNSVSSDFRNAEWDKANVGLWNIPLSRRSVSAKIFVFTGAITCAIACLTLSASSPQNYMTPNPPPLRLGRPQLQPGTAGRSNPFASPVPSHKANQQQSASSRNFTFRLFISCVCGAWLGKWLHGLCAGRFIHGVREKP